MNQGRLKTWEDDRGFGFIKPDDGGKDVFLHISALKRSSRRPKIGDIILYDLAFKADKIRATNASIKGVANVRTKQKTSKQGFFKTVSGIGIVTTIALLTMEFNPSRSPSVVTSITKPECKIKGNISINTGNKIYHLPGMEDYESTIIDAAKGERWFCSESEATSHGWTKAPR
jgi:cold shock CspA family protein